jgi:hypothetical protein
MSSELITGFFKGYSIHIITTKFLVIIFVFLTEKGLFNTSLSLKSVG